jgi:heme exporter protein B
MGGTPLELAGSRQGRGALGSQACLPLVIATPLLGLFLNLEPLAIGAVALTLARLGTPR